MKRTTLGDLAKAVEDYKGDGATFRKAWSPTLTDADNGTTRALPMAGDDLAAACNSLYAADHFHAETVESHPNVSAVHRCKSHIKKAIGHVEHSRVREGFRAVDDAIDEHGRVVTACPGSESVGRTGMDLSQAYMYLTKALGENIGMPADREGGSMGPVTAGGGDKVSKLDINCFGVPNLFRKALKGSRRMSLAHDAGAWR